MRTSCTWLFPRRKILSRSKLISNEGSPIINSSLLLSSTIRRMSSSSSFTAFISPAAKKISNIKAEIESLPFGKMKLLLGGTTTVLRPTALVHFDCKGMNKWMEKNHDKHEEVFVKLNKKNTNLPSLRWTDCVLISLMWGWIDSTSFSLDDQSWVQRLTPRREKSHWSQRNCNFVSLLMKHKLMQPSGIDEVNKAKNHNSWKTPNVSDKEQKIFDDFKLKAISDSLCERLKTNKSPGGSRKKMVKKSTKLSAVSGKKVPKKGVKTKATKTASKKKLNRCAK